jgi:CD109 antigen
LFRKKTVQVKGNSGASVSFMVTPLKIGHIIIKVTAMTATAGDTVERPLLVQPEGAPFYVNEAIFIDLREMSEVNEKVMIEIPGNAVPNSTRIEVSVVGDLLGSTIKNLESLIR